MLEPEIIEQLQSLFKQLKRQVTFALSRSDQPKQEQLKELLEQVAAQSPLITVKESAHQSETPHFEILVDDQPSRISFRGIPGGHEFSSLILAILYVNDLGKRPDDIMVARIKNLKGPITIRTFVSLSCENCPEVVQACQLMASLHPQFQHEMIDGDLATNEAERLKIQGVPAVFSGDQLISSGKASLADLLERLEATFGVNQQNQTAVDRGQFDVVIIGGGPAGVSAAIYIARKGFKTAIIAERIGGQLLETKGIENLISVPYTEGPLLTEQLNKHLAAYEITTIEQRRVVKIDDQKVIHLHTGEYLSTRAVIIATGAKWRRLGIPGEAEYIGRGVAFCPHCDGPFYKGKDIAVIGGGNSGVEAAIDLAGMVRSVVVIEYLAELKADAHLVKKLRSLTNVRVITHAKTEVIVGNGEKVVGLGYMDRNLEQSHEIALDGVFIQIGLSPRSDLVKEQVELSKYGEIIIDGKGRTSAPWIYAAGDVTTTPFKQIVIAIGEGAKTALTVFEDWQRSG